MSGGKLTRRPLLCGLVENVGLGNERKQMNIIDIIDRLRLHDDERLYAEADILMSEAADEIERLRLAIIETLDENGHLADGDNCTLIKFKTCSSYRTN